MDPELKNSPYCLNCNGALSEGDHYCPHCGQKTHSGKVPVSELLHEFIHTFTHLDGTIFRTLRDLFKPGKLSLAFFSGKHKAYMNPFRLFFVMAIFYIAALSFSAKEVSKEAEELSRSALVSHFRGKVLRDIDSIRRYNVLAWPDTSQLSLIDSLDRKLISLYELNPDVLKADFGLLDTSERYGIVNDVAGLSTRIGDMYASPEDIYEVPLDSIMLRYPDAPFLEKLAFKQLVKVLKKNSSLVDYVIHKTLWVFILMLPFVGLALKLFYRRSRRYYIEHLVFLSHFHSFAFLLFGVYFFFIEPLLGFDFSFVFALAVGLYLLFAMRVYYKQGWFKTIVKFLLTSVSYVMLAVFSMILILVVGFFIF